MLWTSIAQLAKKGRENSAKVRFKPRFFRLCATAPMHDPIATVSNSAVIIASPYIKFPLAKL